jgi:hypothetical protein
MATDWPQAGLMPDTVHVHTIHAQPKYRTASAQLYCATRALLYIQLVILRLHLYILSGHESGRLDLLTSV